MGTERWSCLFWIGVAIAICVGSLRLGLGSLHGPGPGFLSFFSGVILGGLGLIVFVISKPSPPQSREKKTMFVKGRIFRVVLTVIDLICYAVAMEYFGFLISTMVFLFILLKVIEPQRWSIAVGGSALGSGISYLIFEVWLKCQLPKGNFGGIIHISDISQKVWQSLM